MAASVYLETTIPSYLTAWRSPEVVMAVRQQLTQDWWDRRRGEFELFISQVVLDEASAGDPDAVARRLEVLADIPFVAPQPGFEELAERLASDLSFPQKAAADAVHIALAVANRLDYLLTWNFAHIANAVNRPIIEDVCHSMGYKVPVICTPEELM